MHHVVVVFLYKTPEEAWELFKHLNENLHLHATSSHSDVPKQLGSKGGFMRFHIQSTFLMYMWVVSEPSQTQTNPNKNQTKEK